MPDDAPPAPPLDLDAVQLPARVDDQRRRPARGLPEQARVIALATALQESSLRNLTTATGTRSACSSSARRQGWGTAAQIMDPVYAAGKFYDALVQVAGLAGACRSPKPPRPCSTRPSRTPTRSGRTGATASPVDWAARWIRRAAAGPVRSRRPPKRRIATGVPGADGADAELRRYCLAAAARARRGEGGRR